MTDAPSTAAAGPAQPAGATPPAPSDGGRVLHLAHVDEWAAALRTGWFDRSTRGESLAEVGFIHASTSGQIRHTARTFYLDDPDPLLLLVVDVAQTESAGSALRWEPATGSRYPHVYGPIPVAAVVAAVPVAFDESGELQLPDLTALDVIDQPPGCYLCRLIASATSAG